MKDMKYLWPVIIVESGLLTGLLYLEVRESVLMLPAAVFFLLVGPGMAFVRLMRLTDWTVELMLGISLSLVIDALAAAVALYAGLWNPGGVLWGLILLSWVGVGLQLWQTQRASDNAQALSLGENVE
jgi:hypothetical protein